ncbi:hypothetical protein BpHYR1_042627 [Brachionus plicatilis]|uniref:Uncharacterized protein n=1 Tax=Brachionus plicatilis TaxID=10195 RepID=A0A3M7T7R3_BRAPC|nr:hypothetical protein BpHYR1_042627 [Brachionus plicatilis]
MYKFLKKKSNTKSFENASYQPERTLRGHKLSLIFYDGFCTIVNILCQSLSSEGPKHVIGGIKGTCPNCVLSANCLMRLMPSLVLSKPMMISKVRIICQVTGGLMLEA